MASATDRRTGFIPLEPAVLELRDGTPWSSRYDDIYYSRGQGPDESMEVFLRANGLPERWRDRTRFTIAETGFGTGLNFLLTRALWCEHPGRGWLHYLSAELHPFTPADLARVFDVFPRVLRDPGNALLEHYPEPVPGFHRLIFPRERISLTLLFGDAADCFARCDAQVDAWYLDGFAPDRNPGLWHADLYTCMVNLTPPGGTLASYTAAGHVRRGLEAAGFHMARHPGYGAKRERLTGWRTATPAAVDTRLPWFRWPSPMSSTQRHATVIGAGLAGSSAALALARRGWDVTVVDGAGRVASGASGNPAGILMPHLSADHGVLSRFTLQAADFARHWIELLHASRGTLPRDWCGALWLADGPRLARRLERIAEHLPLPDNILRVLNPAQAGNLAGVPLSREALWLVRAGWVDPAALCRVQLEVAGVTVITGRQAVRLTRNECQWSVEDSDGTPIARSPCVVLANGAGLPGLHPGIEPRPLRGQLSLISPTPATAGLRCVLCYEGYVTPATNHGHVCGASFVREDTRTDMRAQEHAANLAALHRVWPQAMDGISPVMNGRAALRYNAPGRLPLAGPVPDMMAFDALYRDLHHGRPVAGYPDVPCLPGIYASLAHGSRGLTTTPLAAELVASQMHGDPVPLPRDLVEALHPARERVRILSKSGSRSEPGSRGS